MKAMKQHIAKLSPVASFRNLCITGSVTATTSLPAFAGVIDTSAVESAITDGQGDMKTIGSYIVDALVILAIAGLIYNMLRKAQRVLQLVWLGAFFAGAFIAGYRTGELF